MDGRWVAAVLQQWPRMQRGRNTPQRSVRGGAPYMIVLLDGRHIGLKVRVITHTSLRKETAAALTRTLLGMDEEQGKGHLAHGHTRGRLTMKMYAVDGNDYAIFHYARALQS
jgi:hypothetical protein